MSRPSSAPSPIPTVRPRARRPGHPVAKAGALDRAEALARAITYPEDHATLAALATSSAEAGDMDRASRLSPMPRSSPAAITDPHQ